MLEGGYMITTIPCHSGSLSSLYISYTHPVIAPHPATPLRIIFHPGPLIWVFSSLKLSHPTAVLFLSIHQKRNCLAGAGVESSGGLDCWTMRTCKVNSQLRIWDRVQDGFHWAFMLFIHLFHLLYFIMYSCATNAGKNGKYYLLDSQHLSINVGYEYSRFKSYLLNFSEMNT